MKILCDAIAFCYGPSTALKRILDVWCIDSDSLAIIATGTTKEFFQRTEYSECLIDLDTEDIHAMQNFTVEDYDVYLCVCNPVGYEYIAPRIKTTIYVDFLFWMRTHELVPAEFEADYFIAEKYPGFDQVVDKYSPQISNFIPLPVLAPWCPESISETSTDTYILNLGGQRSRLTIPGVNTNYPAMMVECFQEAAMQTECDANFLVTSDFQTAQELSVAFERTGWSFRSMEHDEFLNSVSQSSRVFTHPGLYSPFEAIGLNKPTLFLPSSNYTQILQLEHFRRVGLAPVSLEWSFLGCGTVESGLDEAVGVDRVLNLIATADSQKMMSSMTSEFCRWLRMSNSDMQDIGRNQRDSAAEYFGDYDSILREVLVQVSKGD